MSTHSPTLEDAINKVCDLLPDGYQLSLVCERGSGWLTLTDPDGTELEIGGEPRDPLADQVLHAIEVAQNHA